MVKKVSVSILLLAFGLLNAQARGDAPKRLVLLHHNDFHAANMPYEGRGKGGVEVTYQGVAGILGLAKAVRDTCGPSLWLFGGDEFTGTPISSITKGASQIQFTRRLHYDAAVIGNHEFDPGLDRVMAFRDSIGVPVLGGANLLNKDGTPFARAYLDTTLNSIPVRIIGLVPPDLEALVSANRLTGLTVVEPAVAVRKYLPDKDRLCILLTHEGFDEDSALARLVPEADIIVGGHSHSTLMNPRLVGPGSTDDRWHETWGDGTSRLGGTLIVQAGSSGRFLGYLSLMVKDGDIVKAYGRLLPNDASLALPDAELAAYARQLDAKYSAALEEVIATTSGPMTRRGAESDLGRWETDVFRAYGNADVAFTNSGGLRKDLEAGPIRLRDIWETNPFGNSLLSYEITGAELIRVMEFIASGQRDGLQCSGITATINRDTKKATDIRVNGKPIESERVYTAVCSDYIYGHFDKYFGLEAGSRKKTDFGAYDRDVLIEACRKSGTIDPPRDVRLTYLP